jgi:hypothetical protein
MTEKEIRKALLDLDAATPGAAPDPRQLARSVVERDQRQVRLLAGVSILLWLVAAAGVLFVVYGALVHLYPRQKLLFREAALGKLTGEEVDALQATHFMVVESATVILAASFIALTLAALCTVLLVLVSRRATLRQINRNLVEISEQLKPPRKPAEQSSPAG